MKKLFAVLFSLASTLPAFANGPSALYVGAYGGYGNISGGYRQDGEVAQGRFAAGIEVVTWQKINFGMEASIQSGNSMRLDVSQAILDTSGGLPIQATLKPVLDFLITAKFPYTSNPAFSGLLKVGGAYRQLQLSNRLSSRDELTRVHPELQAGISYQLAEHARVATYYQGIFSSKNAGVSLASNGDVLISRIPSQHAGFIGFEYII